MTEIMWASPKQRPILARSSTRDLQCNPLEGAWSLCVVLALRSMGHCHRPPELALYQEQCIKLLDMTDDIRAFIRSNESSLKTKS